MFVYLSKKINIPKTEELFCVRWNHYLDYLAVGGSNGVLKILRLSGNNILESNRITVNQTLLSHKDKVLKLCWNEAYRKLTSCDSNGKIVVWLYHKESWFEEMVNNRKKSVVRDLGWSPDGRKICIVYQDGLVIVGTVDGNRLWSKELSGLELKAVSWSPDSTKLLVTTLKNEVTIVSARKGSVLGKLKLAGRKDEIVTILYPSEDCLAVCYERGNVHLFKGPHDTAPTVIKSNVHIRDARFDSSKSVLAVGGVHKGTKANVVEFYSAFGGHYLQTLKISSKKGKINALTWDRHSLRLGIVMGTCLYFAIIRKNWIYSYFEGSCVFRHPSDIKTLVFVTKTAKTRKTYNDSIVHIGSNQFQCYMVMQHRNGKDAILQKINSIGNQLKSFNVKKFSHVSSQAFQKNILIVTSTFTIVLIDTESGRKRRFHANDSSCSHVESTMDRGKNKITAVAVTRSGRNNLFFLSRESGKIQIYSLKSSIDSVGLKSTINFKYYPNRMLLANNFLAVIDLSNILRVYAFEFVKKLKKIDKTGVEKKDVWGFVFCENNPSLYVAIQKDRLLIFKNHQIQEPRKCGAYPLHFENLVATCIDLDGFSQTKTEDLMIEFKTKSLTDTKHIIQEVSIDDAYRYILENEDHVLWRLLGRTATMQLDLNYALKAFIKLKDYANIRFVNQLKQVTNESLRKAMVFNRFGKPDKAESVYRKMGRNDLLVQSKLTYCDLFWLAGNMELVKNEKDKRELHKLLGEHYMDRHDYATALPFLIKAGDYKTHAKCLWRLEDYQSLEGFLSIIEIVAGNKPLLLRLGEILRLVGNQNAMEFYVKAGEPNLALAFCLRFNLYNEAVDLIKKHGLNVNVESVIKENSKNVANTKNLILVYQNSSNIKMLVKTFSGLIQKEPNYSKKKMLAVHMALIIKTILQRDIKKKFLLKENIWSLAEGVHYFLLATKFLYRGNIKLSLFNALRCLNYEKDLDKEKVFSLIALTSFLNKNLFICSKYLSKLDLYSVQVENPNLKKLRDLQIQIFTKYNLKKKERKELFLVNCKSCLKLTEAYLNNCSNCGNALDEVSVYSGKMLSEKELWRCENCSHFTSKDESFQFKFCPFCHYSNQ